MGKDWQPISRGDETAIRVAWEAHLQPTDTLVIPTPSWSWRGQALAQYRSAVEAEFANKLLTAFRRCTHPGERLWVIDWHHSWYSLDPHTASVASRPVPTLPDGDSYNYVAPDFRFGLLMGWHDTGPVTLFGADLLAAFAADPPVEFLRSCGPGQVDESFGRMGHGA